MDASSFDRLTQVLATASSRRLLLRGLATLGLAGGFVSDVARAQKRKKLKRNAFGCVNVGGKCRGKDGVCCSGICQGKKPKKGKKDRSKCMAHNVLDCPPGVDTCTQFLNFCGTQTGACYQTTGQASFCGAAGPCVACRKDADCEAQGPGAACIVCEDCPAPFTACFSAAA